MRTLCEFEAEGNDGSVYRLRLVANIIRVTSKVSSFVEKSYGPRKIFTDHDEECISIGNNQFMILETKKVLTRKYS